MDEKFISILVPCFNTEKYIGKCIESILNQTYGNFELILLNDGSTDNSLNIMQEYAQKDNRIFVISRENKGIAISRNELIKRSHGEYVMFVDSDDTISKYILEDMIKAMKESNAELAVSPARFVYEPTNEEIIQNGNLQYDVFDKKQMMYEFIRIEDFYHYPVAKLYKKELLNNIEFPINRIYEDSSTIYKILYNLNNNAVVLKQPYYNYLRGREDSITTKKYSQKHLNDNFLYLNERHDFYMQNMPELSNESKLGYLKNAFNLLSRAYNSKDDEIINSEIVKQVENNISIIYNSIDDFSKTREMIGKYGLVCLYYMLNNKREEFMHVLDFIEASRKLEIGKN